MSGSLFQDKEVFEGAAGLGGRLLVHVQPGRERRRRLPADPAVQADRPHPGPRQAGAAEPREGVEPATFSKPPKRWPRRYTRWKNAT